MEFTLKTLTDAEINAEMNRTKGRTSEWPKVLAEILASPDCDISKSFGVKIDFPDRKNATVVAGLRKAAKNAKHETLVIRTTPDSETEINITNSPVKA